jgi:hypothetical protein
LLVFRPSYADKCPGIKKKERDETRHRGRRDGVPVLRDGRPLDTLDPFLKKGGEGRFHAARKADVDNISDGVSVFTGFVFSVADALKSLESLVGACSGIERDIFGTAKSRLALHLAYDCRSNCAATSVIVETEGAVGGVDP